jgi:hypothetical protein
MDVTLKLMQSVQGKKIVTQAHDLQENIRLLVDSVDQGKIDECVFRESDIADNPYFLIEFVERNNTDDMHFVMSRIVQMVLKRIELQESKERLGKIN